MEQPAESVAPADTPVVVSRRVATLVGLLASPRAGNVTGSYYVIDGGLIKTM